MLILKILLYFLAIYGLSFMFVYQDGPFKIFARIRNISNGLNELLSCMFCTPTWLGAFASLINIFLFPSIPFTIGFLIYGSTACWPIIFAFDFLLTPVIVHIFDLIENKLNNN